MDETPRTEDPTYKIRPLIRVEAGTWKSRDGYWTFRAAENHGHPRPWFAYVRDDDEPVWWDNCYLSLQEAIDQVRFIDERTPADPCP